MPAEVLTSLTGIDEPGRLADTIAAHMGVDLDEKQKILEITGIRPPPALLGAVKIFQSVINST